MLTGIQRKADVDSLPTAARSVRERRLHARPWIRLFPLVIVVIRSGSTRWPGTKMRQALSPAYRCNLYCSRQGNAPERQ